MANAIYKKTKQLMLGADIDLAVDDIKAVLIDTALYTVDAATDEFLSAIAAGARIATSGNLANKTITDGVFDADDIQLNAVSGAESEAIVIYKDTGVAGSSPLIAYIDTATGLPITPNGGDIVVQWSNGVSKIFAL